MNISLEDAARGAPEMSYWPVFASSTMFVSEQTNIQLFFILISIFSGSVMYLSLTQFILQINISKKTLSKKSAVARGAKSKHRDYTMEELIRMGNAIFPNSKKIKALFILAILTNVSLGVYNYLYLVGFNLYNSDVNLASLILIILPLLYICNLLIYCWI
jgi:hypothetical protein